MARPRGNQSHYRPFRSQLVSLSSTSAQSNVFDAQVQVILLTSTVDAFIELGDSPTALADGTSMFLQANKPMRLTVHPSERVAGITSTGSGNLYITEMSQ